MPDLLSYSDETGNHSAGAYFVVAGFTLDGYHNDVREALRQAETTSKKEKRDWRGSSLAQRRRYIEAALRISHLEKRIFFRRHARLTDPDYIGCTAETLIATGALFGIQKRWMICAHEGFTVANRTKLHGLLAGKGQFEVRSGAFKERPEIRLADALCGLIAEVHFRRDGDDYADLVKDWFYEV